MDLNPFSYDFHENPYPIYRWLRDHAPVYRNDALNFYALSRYDDVLTAILDHDAYSSAKGTVLEIKPEMIEQFPIILFMDPPRHTRLRKLVSHAFTPRRMAALEPTARALATGYIDRILEQGSCDFIRDFAARLPIEIISTMVGVPPSDRDLVRELTDTALHREPDRPEFPDSALAANAQLVQYFAGLVAERRKQPRDDMTSLLIDAEVEDDDGEKVRLTDFEIVAFCGLLSGAGNETVTKLLGNAVVLLARHPDARADLVRDFERIPDAVEEILRYWTPAQYTMRTLLRDVTVHGQTMPRDARVLLLIGSATRDEREYTDADAFDITRKVPTQIAFGYGLHHCLGASLARLESRVSLEELHRRIPEYEIDESRLERVHMSNVHGFASVPMRF
ncbi:MAG: cytochrome P450 [Deltaproteobacteria bacterium]|nr:cytochrome P450 [Deltaproteobacteria bacterium]MBI3388780.1 cytochrome P450 [Deltaproteobacteria bacterium]